MRTFYTLVLALASVSAYAQRYEVGFHGGPSLYTAARVEGGRSAGTADAGFKSGIAAGMTVGHDMYDRLGGEIRYSFLRNDAQVKAGGQEAMSSAQSHALHYDLLLHFSSFRSRIRPYAAFGGGVKYYRGTGEPSAFQPLTNFAIPTRTNEVRPMVSFGGGVKIGVTDNISFRIDVHDFLTQFPAEVITPGPGASVGGWLHNIVPSAGIAFRF